MGQIVKTLSNYNFTVFRIHSNITTLISYYEIIQCSNLLTELSMYVLSASRTNKNTPTTFLRSPMDTEELISLLDSLTLPPVSDEEFDAAANTAKDMTNLSNDQRLQLYGSFRP
jgi:hypothetical protein